MATVTILTPKQYDELQEEFKIWAAESGSDRELDFEMRREELEFSFISSKLTTEEWEVEDDDK